MGNTFFRKLLFLGVGVCLITYSSCCLRKKISVDWEQRNPPKNAQTSRKKCVRKRRVPNFEAMMAFAAIHRKKCERKRRMLNFVAEIRRRRARNPKSPSCQLHTQRLSNGKHKHSLDSIPNVASKSVARMHFSCRQSSFASSYSRLFCR